MAWVPRSHEPRTKGKEGGKERGGTEEWGKVNGRKEMGEGRKG